MNIRDFEYFHQLVKEKNFPKLLNTFLLVNQLSR